MELRYRREVLVGAMLMMSAVAFVFLMLWLKGKPLRSGHVVTVTFTNVAGLKVGDQVHTAGVLVGNVRSIKLDHATLKVKVVVDISHGPPPHADARFTVRPLDLLGARFLDYVPGTAAQLLARNQTIEGSDVPELSDMASGLATEGRTVMANAAELVGPRMAAELRATFAQAQRTLEALQRAGTRPSDTLVAALREVVRVGHRLDLLLDRASDPAVNTVRNMEQASANMTTITRTLTHTSAALDTLLTTLNSRRGSAGQLLNDSTTLSELRATNHALYDLLTDFKANPRRYVNLRVF